MKLFSLSTVQYTIIGNGICIILDVQYVIQYKPSKKLQNCNFYLFNITCNANSKVWPYVTYIHSKNEHWVMEVWLCTVCLPDICPRITFSLVHYFHLFILLCLQYIFVEQEQKDQWMDLHFMGRNAEYTAY